MTSGCRVSATNVERVSDSQSHSGRDCPRVPLLMLPRVVSVRGRPARTYDVRAMIVLAGGGPGSSSAGCAVCGVWRVGGRGSCARDRAARGSCLLLLVVRCTFSLGAGSVSKK